MSKAQDQLPLDLTGHAGPMSIDEAQEHLEKRIAWAKEWKIESITVDIAALKVLMAVSELAGRTNVDPSKDPKHPIWRFVRKHRKDGEKHV